jgi:hypothetical protein
VIGNDFGNWRPATKSGMKFEDLDADGVKDAGEPGLSGWTIFVDYDDDGTADAGEPSAVTAADGTYLITGINPGTWKVKEVAQVGWTCSYPSPCYHQETFTSSAALTDNDFGNYQYATKSGAKWEDLNQDGVWDALEPAMTMWPIWLFDGVSWTSTSTDINGYYEFPDLMPGVTYVVCEELLAGYTQTFPTSMTTPPTGETIVDCSLLTGPVGVTLGQWGYQFYAESGDVFDENDFANYMPTGCTYTMGYWKTHSSYGPAPYDEEGWGNLGDFDGDGIEEEANEALFGSGMTWYEAFNTAPKGGEAWFILAHQYMAAYLNVQNGAGSVPNLTIWLADAADLLDYYDGPPPSIPKDSPDRAYAIMLADYLDQYNNGELGVPHCGE